MEKEKKEKIKMVLEYYPSISFILQASEQTSFPEHTKFWESNHDWKYDKLLVSFAYQGKQNVKELFRMRPDVMVMGDSGGFQVEKIGATFEPADVLRWQEKNCDVAFNLDIPSDTPEKFERSLVATKKYVEVYNNNRVPDRKCDILNIIHGWSLKQYHDWIDRVIKPYENFDGIGLSVRESTSKDIELYKTVFPLESEPKRFHVLGVSAYLEIAGLLLLAKKFPKTIISTDSSSFSMKGKNRNFEIDNFGHCIPLGTKKGFPNIKGIPCKCPVCSGTTFEKVMSQSIYASSLISMHNLYKFLEFFEMAEKLSGDFNLLCEFMTAKYPRKKVYETLSKYMFIAEEGSESFRKKYIDGQMSGVGFL
jgi:queuine/archaeosine tRNA-ribosyltransferase